MDDVRNDGTRRRVTRVAGAVCLLLLLAVSCAIVLKPQQWDPAFGPVVPHDTFPADCSLCHTTGDWHELRDDFAFDHNKETSYALRGAHAKASCLRCHNDRGPVETFSARGCAGCHEDVHKGELGATCTECHNEETWKPRESIAKHDRTRFPLVGAHTAVECVLCHKGAERGQFSGLDTACASCHIEDANRVALINHKAVGFSGDCQTCHTQFGWGGAKFDHPASFPLRDAHKSVRCAACHKEANIETISNQCSSCHLEDFVRADNPNHQKNNFGTNCTECHTATTWNAVAFQHPSTFPLRGGHKSIDCSECHTQGIAPGLSTDCTACHMDDYERANNPNHVEAQFSTECAQCHSTISWTRSTFNHPSSFPLTLGHGGLECAQCHEGEVGPVPADCASCHLDEYQGVTDPNHETANFSTDCTECHTTRSWQGASFNHPDSFPLTLGHGNLDCAQCHDDPIGAIPTDCVSCHRNDYDEVTDPNHVASDFSTDCTQCHSTESWEGATFEHPSTFPLTKGHKNLECTQCHTDGTGPLPTDCVNCHRDNYDATTDPNHAQAEFSTDCTECHTTRTWEGAEFEHPSAFPLTKGHKNLDCSQCHESGIGSLPTDCVTCHREDFDATTDPNHVTSEFSTDCTECHTTRMWQGADFEHPASFPLTLGHDSLGCTQCHEGGTGPIPADCASCHRDDFDATNDPNHAVGGYPTDCTQCHTTEGWEGASFDHPATFPLTRGHKNLDCNQCHEGGIGPLPTDCASCHQDDFDETTDPNHVASQFSTTCTECHTTRSWEGAEFTHPETFPLTLGHGSLDCSQCHEGGTGPIPADCVSCHRDDYDSVTKPNHATSNFSTECTQCHTIENWENATFAHPDTFPLTRGHKNLDCAVCHTGGIGPLPTDCASCHRDDYDGTTDPNHAASEFSTNCTECHSTRSWEGADFEHPATFPLTLGHGNLDCTQCHEGGTGPIPSDCVSCHRDDFDGTDDPNHVASGYPTECTQCHSTESWEGATFDHPASFPLTRGHKNLECSQCHTNGTGPIPADCVSCHRDNYDATSEPNHTTAGISLDCAQCHRTGDWSESTFKHPNSFPLTKGHRIQDCAQCHASSIGPIPTDCASCHLNDYQDVNDPNHAAAGFPTDCTECHSTSNWSDALFAHPLTFPLTAGHGGLQCSVCHVGQLGDLPSDCASCHLDEFQATTDPDHESAAFSTDCTQCHSTTTWDGATFAHPATFPLTGGHSDVSCATCHQGSIGPIPTDCASCHLDEYQATTDPNHSATGIPTDCTQCHSTNTWQGATFTHPSSFPLAAGHSGLNCSQCHEGSVGPLPTDCASCHLGDYQSTTDPNHAQSNFPTDCTQCHTTTSWEGATFEHPTSFPLTAGHGGLSCAECHQGTIGPLPIDCSSCHLDEYQSATDPNHAASGFPTDCTQCHTTTSWGDATFVHPTTFPLTQGHRGLECNVCHQGGLGPLPTNCDSCHLDDYQTTTDPNHVAAGFPLDCTECHTTATWEGARFEHPASFPLSGGHSSVDCSACHVGVVGPLPTDCQSCHLDDFQQATNPNHATSGFPTDCTQCHSTTSWAGATITHPASFPLTAAHGGLNCTDCHTGGIGPLPTDCVSCHLSDYQSTADPNHAASGFPTDCTQCHTATTWDGATFQHPASFPLAGGHAAVACSMCHEGGIGPLQSDCVNCHLDDYQQVTDPNHETSGFPQDCTQCHSTTSWEGATFVHPTSFPLTGGHGALDCAQCHQGSIGPLPTDCQSCHLSDYQQTTDPNHAASGFPLDCTECHTTTTWQGAVFNHPFPITSGPHRRLDCADCHTTPGNSSAFSCTHCHEHRQSEADDEHQDVNGYVWQSAACLDCHPNGREKGQRILPDDVRDRARSRAVHRMRDKVPGISEGLSGPLRRNRSRGLSSGDEGRSEGVSSPILDEIINPDPNARRDVLKSILKK